MAPLADIVVTAAQIIYAVLALLLLYFVVKITIRLVRGAFDINRWYAGYAQGRVMGRTFRYAPDAAAIAGLYAVMHLWGWVGLPTGF